MARDAYAHVTVKPGVRAYLKQCRAEGRRMAVVTSSVPEHCRTALTHLDLMKYFEGVTLAHDLGLEKKDPALWRAAAEHYGVAPEDCTVFDDSLSACKGARAAKMRVVGVYDGFFAQDEAAMRGFCDVYIRSFEELLFRDCRFQSCRLRNCDFTGAAFYGCTFTGCLLENCRLSATYWKDCRLSGCKWDGADLRRSRWKDSVLEETLLRYVNFSGGVWERISVKECDFTESTLSEMRLKKAAMEKTDLTGAELFRTSLAGMDLTACTLDRIVLSETCRELKGAVINAAQAAVVARILGIRVEP